MSKNKNQNKIKAISLIEIIVVIAIFSILIALVFPNISLILKQNKEISNIYKVETDIVKAEKIIKNSIYSARDLKYKLLKDLNIYNSIEVYQSDENLKSQTLDESFLNDEITKGNTLFLYILEKDEATNKLKENFFLFQFIEDNLQILIFDRLVDNSLKWKRSSIVLKSVIGFFEKQEDRLKVYFISNKKGLTGENKEEIYEKIYFISEK